MNLVGRALLSAGCEQTERVGVSRCTVPRINYACVCMRHCIKEMTFSGVGVPGRWGKGCGNTIALWLKRGQRQNIVTVGFALPKCNWEKKQDLYIDIYFEEQCELRIWLEELFIFLYSQLNVLQTNKYKRKSSERSFQVWLPTRRTQIFYYNQTCRSQYVSHKAKDR